MPVMATDSSAPSVALDSGGPHTVAEWERVTAAVLRKSRLLSDDASDHDVWDKLARRTLDGISVPALGTASLTADLPAVGLPGQSPYTRGTVAVRELQAWDIRSQFADPDADLTAEHILGDLENGVNSLWLEIGPDAIALDDVAKILDTVFLGLAPVVLSAPHDPVAAAHGYAAIVRDLDIDPHPLSNLGVDPIGNLLRTHGETSTDVVAHVADIAMRLKIRAVVVDGTAVHDAGGSDVQELAYSLAAGAAYLRVLLAAGHSVDEAANLLEFRYAATDEQFPTIAKFRAARRLWHRVAELSGVSAAARGQLQHGVTSRPMMSKYAPQVNLLRTTLAAFAAGVGGASSVTVLPFDTALGLPEAFSRRIARNTSSLLIAEAHVAKVTDPAGGSYSVEKLTDDLARAAWTEFGAIEAAGGIAAAIADGSLAARIAATAEERQRQIATRKRPLTAVTEFPILNEVLPARRPYPYGVPVVTRYGAEFEALRDEPAETTVFLATLGSVASFTARVSFMANLFAAGGIDTTLAGATADAAALVAAYDRSPVVCLAGADATYAEWGSAAIDALRAAGARWVILAGKPRDLAVDDSAALGVDALAFLQRTRKELSK